VGTVTVITAERALALAAESVVSGVIEEDGDLILTKQDGTTINAGSVGSVVDTTGLRILKNAVIDIDGGDPQGVVETTTIANDGTDTATWVNRLVYKYLGAVGAVARKTFYLNEYGELRVAPAKSTTTAARFYVKDDPTNPPEARDPNVPVVELSDDPVNRNSLRAWLGDGTTTRKGIKMADVLVLNASDPVPAGTPSGTLILRTANPVPLNLNPDFEFDTSSWTGAGGTFTRDTTVHHSGVASGKIVATGGAAVTMTSNKGAVVAGNTYKTDGYLRAATAITLNLNVNWYTSGSVYISTSSASVNVTANTWTHISNSFVAPATAALAAIVPTIAGTPAAGVTMWADDIYLSI
jgi:hypothetical protein